MADESYICRPLLLGRSWLYIMLWLTFLYFIIIISQCRGVLRIKGPCLYAVSFHISLFVQQGGKRSARTFLTSIAIQPVTESWNCHGQKLAAL